MFSRSHSRRGKKKVEKAGSPAGPRSTVRSTGTSSAALNADSFDILDRIGNTRMASQDAQPPERRAAPSGRTTTTPAESSASTNFTISGSPLYSNPIQSPKNPQTIPRARAHYMRPILEIPTPVESYAPQEWTNALGRNVKQLPSGLKTPPDTPPERSSQEQVAVKIPKKRRFGGLFSRKTPSPAPAPEVRLHTPDSSDFTSSQHTQWHSASTPLAPEPSVAPPTEPIAEKPRIARKLSRKGPPRKPAVKARVAANRQSRTSRLMEVPEEAPYILQPPSTLKSLNVDIPNVELERYSVMFASVLEQRQQQSIASRRASRRRSRSASRTRNYASPSPLNIAAKSPPAIDMSRRLTCDSPSINPSHSFLTAGHNNDSDRPRSPVSFRRSTGSPLNSPLHTKFDFGFDDPQPQQATMLVFKNAPEVTNIKLDKPPTASNADLPATQGTVNHKGSPGELGVKRENKSRIESETTMRYAEKSNKVSQPQARNQEGRARAEDSIPPSKTVSAAAPRSESVLSTAEIGIARQISLKGQRPVLAVKPTVAKKQEDQQLSQPRVIELGAPGALARYLRSGKVLATAQATEHNTTRG